MLLLSVLLLVASVAIGTAPAFLEFWQGVVDAVSGVHQAWIEMNWTLT